MDSQQIFCQRLTQLLDEKQISQKDLAQIIGCSRQSINLYLLGKRTPDITIAGQMATCLGVSCDYLL
ncbi:MAG: helix-turn-helix transcriptional regulator, partial [Pygmaiobacter sp.]